MSKKLFSDSEDEILVECVSNYRVLFDHENQDFLNTNKKNSMWKKVAEIVGKDGK